MGKATTKTHKKHASINKPLGGRFHRNEFGLLGAPCGKVQTLVRYINRSLKSAYNVGYIDAEHQAQQEDMPGMYSHYIDKIDFHQLNFHSEKDAYQYRTWFNDCHLVMVNGNHFDSEQQIVFLNSKKKASLERKLDRLTNVIAFVQDDEEVHDYLKEKLPHWEEIPIFPISEEDGLIALLHEKIKKPKLKGLVLAGGKSSRMGKDKGAIEYHGSPQREHMASLLKSSCEETYISMAPGSSCESSYPVLEDSFVGLGPFGGILSAFKKDPNAAWLVVACDQPLLDEAHLEKLIAERDQTKLATCFHNPETKFPEPLITIWEPRAYPILLQFLGQGYTCPRKVLINAQVKEIRLEENDFMMNVNTPEEYKGALKKLA